MPWRPGSTRSSTSRRSTPPADVTAPLVAQFERLRAAARAGAARVVVVTGQGGRSATAGRRATPTPPRRPAPCRAWSARSPASWRSSSPGWSTSTQRPAPTRWPPTCWPSCGSSGAPTEVGRTAGGRRTLSTVARPLDADAGHRGGDRRGPRPRCRLGRRRHRRRPGHRRPARGRDGPHHRVRHRAVGRSPLPGPEPDDLAGGGRRGGRAPGDHPPGRAHPSRRDRGGHRPGAGRPRDPGHAGRAGRCAPPSSATARSTCATRTPSPPRSRRSAASGAASTGSSTARASSRTS